MLFYDSTDLRDDHKRIKLKLWWYHKVRKLNGCISHEKKKFFEFLTSRVGFTCIGRHKTAFGFFQKSFVAVWQNFLTCPENGRFWTRRTRGTWSCFTFGFAVFGGITCQVLKKQIQFLAILETPHPTAFLAKKCKKPNTWYHSGCGDLNLRTGGKNYINFWIRHDVICMPGKYGAKNVTQQKVPDHPNYPLIVV